MKKVRLCEERKFFFFYMTKVLLDHRCEGILRYKYILTGAKNVSSATKISL